eukprot:TRINITY_DN6851_c0_g1_i1.p1 TRINITY_DN6851_c0_g1~~TRINITY_DN6851_c0_g1_i1.p1  ORF type:complete len:211 (-),score=41.06 TRINITY_DN6851_c0_g1_i1:25-657(-)
MLKFVAVGLLAVGGLATSAGAQEAADQLIGGDLADMIQNATCNSPFLPNFSTVKSCDDPNLSQALYCMTDGACQCDPNTIYGNQKIDCVPNCSHICYFSPSQKRLLESKIYSVNNKPAQYVSCGWETCDPINRWWTCSGGPLNCTTTTTPTEIPTERPTEKPTGTTLCSTLYGQCGGDNWTGSKCCASGSTCTAQNQYYSQCLPSIQMNK